MTKLSSLMLRGIGQCTVLCIIIDGYNLNPIFGITVLLDAMDGSKTTGECRHFLLVVTEINLRQNGQV